MILVILPTTLFNIKHYPKDIKEVVVWEHPHYFKSYHYNKKKLILHRASMQSYYDDIKKHYKVHYIEFHEKMDYDDYIVFDMVDRIKLPHHYTIIETPNFLLDKTSYEKFYNKNGKKQKVIFNNFYMWSKKELNLYPELKSQDKLNREKFKETKIPSIPKITQDSYINEAKKYITKHFPKNYGNVDNFNYPIDRPTAMKWLKHFIKYKFKKFGPYQDFVVKDNSYMYHSVLSSSINIGLITPLDVINLIKKYKSKIPINSFEGFLRQLFWREYQRYCYIYIKFTGNYFGNKKRLTKAWYNGTTGIEPIDDMIVDGFDKAYIHHIGRLMFIGNYMNLSGIAPKEGFKWFMEFAIDSYEWVMHQNVYEMVFFLTGGNTMRKPYISSSNYIVNMSNYKRGEWADKWDTMYHNFLKKHKTKLWKFRYHFPGLYKI